MTEQVNTVKCLVWDLDNTLWAGTVLEETVGIDHAVRHVLEVLDARGILHSIASKNEPEIAWARLVELGVAEYFIAPQIGWHPKSDSIRRIADQLNFAHDAVAFHQFELRVFPIRGYANLYLDLYVCVHAA